MSAYSFKDLCKLLNCKQVASLKRVMKQRGIKWSLDKDGKPWTTEARLDAAIVDDKRVLTFTKPPCQKKNSPSRRESVKSTAHGTGSNNTSGPSYAG